MPIPRKETQSKKSINNSKAINDQIDRNNLKHKIEKDDLDKFFEDLINDEMFDDTVSGLKVGNNKTTSKVGSHPENIVIHDSLDEVRYEDSIQYKCPFCDGSYKTNDDLKVHIIDEERPKWLNQKDPIHTLKTPDDMFRWFKQYYNLPIIITRKELEKKPIELDCLKCLNPDILKFLIRYKRSNIDMNLYYEIWQKFGKLITESKAKGEY